MARGKKGKATIEFQMPLDDGWDVIVAGGGPAGLHGRHRGRSGAPDDASLPQA